VRESLVPAAVRLARKDLCGDDANTRPSTYACSRLQAIGAVVSEVFKVRRVSLGVVTREECVSIGELLSGGSK